jgi:hypothetical protein
VPQRRCQRHGRHADEREHIPRRRNPARAGVSARRHGAADHLTPEVADATIDRVWRGVERAPGRLVQRAGTCAGGADAATQGIGRRVEISISYGRET